MLPTPKLSIKQSIAEEVRVSPDGGWRVNFELETDTMSTSAPDPVWSIEIDPLFPWTKVRSPAKDIGEFINPTGFSVEFIAAPVPKVPSFLVKANYMGKEASIAVPVATYWWAGYPYLSNSALSWDGKPGDRAAQIILAVLDNLHDDYRKEIRRIPIIRKKDPKKKDDVLAYFSEWAKQGPHIGIYDSTVQSLTNTTQVPDGNDTGFAEAFLHELAHSFMLWRCGDLTEVRLRELYTNLRRFNQWLGNLPVVGVISAITSLPYLFYAAPLRGQGKDPERDFMSDWAEATGWITTSLTSGMGVPLLGVALTWARYEHPNYFTASSEIGKLVGLRNIHMKGQHGKLEKLDAKLRKIAESAQKAAAAFAAAEKEYNDALAKGLTPSPDKMNRLKAERDKRVKEFNETQAEIDKITKPAGVVSNYAATDPHEDWAETLSVPAINGPALSDTTRINFLKKHKLLPPAKPIDFSTWLGYKILLSQDPGSPGTRPLRAERSEGMRTFASGSTESIDSREDEVREATASEEFSVDALLAEVERAVTAWDAGPGALARRNQQVMEKLELPPSDNSLLEILRAAELHGEGIYRYTEGEHPVEEGDLVITRDGNVWMVSRVAEGRIVQMIGDVETPNKARKAAEGPVRTAEEIALHWRPASNKRRWSADGHKGSPAYADLDAALTGMVRLWGQETSPRSKRTVTNMAEFLRELLDLGGITPEDLPLPKKPEDRDALGFCHTHGSGLQVFDPQSASVLPGDMVFLDGFNTIGVVTRVTSDGQMADLVVNKAAKPQLPVVGESGDAESVVQIIHGIKLNQTDAIWRPAGELRKWVPADRTNTDFYEDFNLSLSHLVSHIHCESVEHGGTQYGVSDGGWLIMFNLLLERGVSPVARKTFKGSTLKEGTLLSLRNAIYTYGAPTSQSAAAPGDLISWKRGKRDAYGLVLKVTERGEPSLSFVDGERFDVLNETIPIEMITEQWTPGLAPRGVVGDELQAFYGEPPALFELVSRRGNVDTYETHRLRGESYSFSRTAASHVAMLLALQAPEWLRARLWSAQSEQDELEGLQARVGTLGNGLQEYRDGVVLPVGAWVFLKGAGFGAVLSQRPDGQPAMLLMASDDDMGIEPFTPDKARHYWVPSTRPFAYVSADTGAADTGAAYTDLNGILGHLRLWGATKPDLWQPLFSDSGLLDSGWLEPQLAKFLAKGPSNAEEWPQFLAEAGGGLRPAEEAAPGDFLMFKDGRQAILLDNGEMLVLADSTLRIARQASAQHSWRPVLK